MHHFDSGHQTKLMFLKPNKPVTITMSLLSVLVFVIILLLTTVKSDIQEQPTTPINFKEYMTNMIKEQSSKIQMLLKKIQTNAKSMLKKIDKIKQDTKQKNVTPKMEDIDERQLESPLPKPETVAATVTNVESRSFGATHYTTTGYGASGNGNYGGHGGAPAYHHHSIGFDPVNIMVSLSLLTFLLQTLQGLLSRATMPTPVVQGRNLNPVIQEWLKNFEDNSKSFKVNKYLKKKYPKKYYVR